MKKILLPLLICGFLFISDFGISQKLKPIQSKVYYAYYTMNTHLQHNYDFLLQKSELNLILKSDEKPKDSVIIIQAKLNKHNDVIDTLIVRESSGRKLKENIFLDTLKMMNEPLRLPYNFYPLFGTLNGKQITYDYLDELSKTEKSIYLIENYKAGKKQGEFIEYYKSGQQVFEIKNYENDLLDDSYIQFNRDGTYKMKGTYKNNLKNGTWIYYQADNKAGTYEQYKDGKLHGQSKKWHLNGNVELMTNYQDGLIHSFYYTYYPNKQIKDSCSYNFGKLSGKMVAYYENGQLQKTCDYKDGNPISDYKYWDENGQLLQLFPYRYGFLNGNVLKYFPNGKKKEDYWMKNDTLDGDYLTYYENGKVKSKAKYKMGVIQKGAQYFDSTGKKITDWEVGIHDSPDETFINPPVVQIEQIETIESGLTIQPTEITMKNMLTKDEVKLWKKYKGKEFKIHIANNNSYQLIFDEKVFSSKSIAAFKVLFDRNLIVKAERLHGGLVDCTVTVMLD